MVVVVVVVVDVDVVVDVVVVVVVVVDVVVVVVVVVGHSDGLQSSSSVEFPKHCSMPTEAGSLHARALILDPSPHDVEQ